MVISFDQTKLENENKVLKEKFEKLSKDLAKGTSNFDKLIGILLYSQDRKLTLVYL